GDVYFADMSTSIVRPHCLENLRSGMLPQRWMGNRIFPLKQWGGCDVDYEWQVPQVEFWLRKHGFTETVTPYANDRAQGKSQRSVSISYPAGRTIRKASSRQERKYCRVSAGGSARDFIRHFSGFSRRLS